MFERGDDVLYVCYDNEAYMNTGVQRSSATPPAARTANTKPVGDEPGNVFGQGKNAPLIAMAHEIPYVATATVAELHDLEAKVERAMELHGPRYLHVLVPCPLGWGTASRETIQVARLAKETGLFPVFEAEHGAVTAVSKIRRRVPVEEYLRLQKRYAHLFGDPPRADVVALLQAIADRNIRRFGLLEDDDTIGTKLMPLLAAGRPRDGEAVRDHARRRLEPRQQDGQLAHRAARLPRPDAALQPGLPGRREHPVLAVRGRGGRRRLRARLAADHGGEPLPGRHGAGLLPPVRDGLQSRAARRGGRHQLRRALPRRPRDRAGLAGGDARRPGKRVLVVGAGPSGLSAAYHLARLGHEVTIRDAGPAAGGMMRFGIPKYRLPREILDAEIDRIIALGVTLELDTTVTNILDGDAMRAI